MYSNAYPVTPKMGLRETFNAMLSHVAYSQSMGYDAPSLQAANHRGLLRDFAPVVTEVYINHTSTLQLAPRVTESGMLAELWDVLEVMCNDYPAYSDELLYEVEDERETEAIIDATGVDDFAASAIRSELGGEPMGTISHESDGSVYINESALMRALRTLGYMRNAQTGEYAHYNTVRRMFDADIDAAYSAPVTIGGVTVWPYVAAALEASDPIAYRESFLQWADVESWGDVDLS